MSANGLKSVADTVKSITELGAKADKVKDQLSKDIAEASDALDLAAETSKSIRDAGAALRGLLGTQSNNPPEDHR